MTGKTLLAGDIGGTNCRLAYFSSSLGVSQPLHEENFKNRDYQDFEELLQSYLDLHPLDFTGICLSIAGPVIDNRVDITNLGWVIDGDRLQDRYQLGGVWLLNDLGALSYGVLQLQKQDLVILREGQPVDRGAIAVIAPGTGLGEGFLIWNGQDYQAISTEGGHADFGPTNELQIRLAEYLQKQGIRTSNEQVCSGIGIPYLYRFLRDEGLAPEPDWFGDLLQSAADPTPLIVSSALDESRSCQLCQMTVDLFVSILGAEAGNLALRTLSLGGIYIGGGIPPRILPYLKKETFLDALDDKEPHQELLARIPVKVVVNPIPNLIGAACYGLRELQ
ncbi:MAG: glucokinase [Anaerolineales bacterium]